jgi:uncharacterized damage-inducible protein DinB
MDGPGASGLSGATSAPAFLISVPTSPAQPAMTAAFLRELFVHMEWSDAKVFQAANAAQPEDADEQLLKTLTHLHHTQFAFYGAWLGEFDWKSLPQFNTLTALEAWVREIYPAIQAFAGNLTDKGLESESIMPWAAHFAKRQLGIQAEATTLGETVYQVAAHSSYHRGQANTRIRELGGEPPTVDYIVWVWAGRPAPDWAARTD